MEEVVEVEVPLIRKRKRLMRASEMVPVREGALAGEAVLAGAGPDRGRRKGKRGKTHRPKRDPGQ